MDEEDAQPRLEQLVLAGNGIGMQGAQAVAAALPKLIQLQVQLMAFWGAVGCLILAQDEVAQIWYCDSMMILLMGWHVVLKMHLVV